MEPTFSGIAGMICAAFGMPREGGAGEWPSLEELAELEFGVRVLREPLLAEDFQTAGGGDFSGRKYGVYKADGKPGDTVTSMRCFLADGDFLAGLSGPVELLEHIQRALLDPVWPLYLGRRSYVPSLPVVTKDSLKNLPLEDALCSITAMGRKQERSRFVLPARMERDGEIRRDIPISFERRRYLPRRVVTKWM